jgi:hypothetical protein
MPGGHQSSRALCFSRNINGCPCFGKPFAAQYVLGVLDPRLGVGKRPGSNVNHGVLVPDLFEDLPLGRRKQKANFVFATTGPVCPLLPRLDHDRRCLRIVFQLVRWSTAINAAYPLLVAKRIIKGWPLFV